MSEGCRNCYAFALHDMRHKAFTEGKKLPKQYAKPFSEIQLFPDRLEQPLKWRKPRQIFVNSMSDPFHDDVPFDFIDKVFAVMALTPWHTYQILTKRPERMKTYLTTNNRRSYWASAANDLNLSKEHVYINRTPNPLPNVWLGVSVENQRAADERIPLLLQTPAAVRFLSCEPLLGPVNLEFWTQFEHPDNEGYGLEAIKGLDWVIVGGESGTNARPMHPEWAESLRDQCEEYRVPFFFKQWGEFAPHDDDDDPEFWVTYDGEAGFVHTCMPPDNYYTFMNRIGKKRAGRLLDGREWNEFPGGERDASRA
ncbi:phage Gp37/Gp68 family protein [Brevibacillus sp. B_LB10_24]|uniref:phage Gp37/Gp68 family protein n=1 Tax=Brevibacillus sp. B_LB10_24 TaxID=3380645 RepID=UPI0038B954E4